MKVNSARDIFKNDMFLLKLFDSAIRNYRDAENPIRFNNFCYAIRELIREKLAIEAPDGRIIKCVWYDTTKEKPTRADRIRYYIVKGLIDDNIPDTIVDKLNDVLDNYKELIDILNKYTHISRGTLGINDEDGLKWFNNVIDLLIDFIKLIDNLRDNVKTKLIDVIKTDIEQELFENLPDEVDLLSTHSSIDEITDIEIEIEEMDYEFVQVKGMCDVGIDLQWGSSSDIENDYGAEGSVNYPMSFTVTIEINDLSRREYSLGEIDTSSYYE
jgi:hypothetical protein